MTTASPQRLFSPTLEKELAAFEGRWTGIVGDRVVASGDTPAEVLGDAERAGFSDVLLHFVPEQGKAYFF